MDSIGGYHELELKKGEHYHKNALRLNSARNCLEYIILAKGYKKIFIPYYTCEVILTPIIRNKIKYEFYYIDKNFNPCGKFNLHDDEAFLYTNYFGIKDNEVEVLADLYKDKLIVDNSQAFFSQSIQGIDTFYSPRKFFGVPDGGYLYTDQIFQKDFEKDVSYNKMAHLLKRADISAEFGYEDFLHIENNIDNEEIKLMSNLTDKLLRSIDYNESKYIRINNFMLFHEKLKSKNIINIDMKSINNLVPFTYPYLDANGIINKKKLIENKIFIPTFWQNVLNWTDMEWECFLVKNLVPFPISTHIKNIDEILNLIK